MSTRVWVTTLPDTLSAGILKRGSGAGAHAKVP